MSENLLTITNLKKYFKIGKGEYVYAVDDVSFQIERGETVGIVGESGCGKTTLGRTILGLYKADEGKIIFDGNDIVSASKKQLHKFKKRAQIILQDPYASFNPRMTISQIISEGMEAHRLYNTKKEKQEAVYSLLELVGLAAEHADRFPHEFSGGQRQRVGIARALAVNPEFLVCDEPISSLDVSIQAQIVNLLVRLQKELNMTYLFIAHDLSVVKYISDKVGVMYLGRLIEFADCIEFYKNPLHPYSQILISAIPSTDIDNPMMNRRIHFKTETTEVKTSGLSFGKFIYGKKKNNPDRKLSCPFAPKCPKATAECKIARPDLKEVSKGHFIACWNI